METQRVFNGLPRGKLPPHSTNRKAHTQLQSNIINELNNISESINIIKDTLFDSVDELTKIESELNEIKKKQGILVLKGAENNRKR